MSDFGRGSKSHSINNFEFSMRRAKILPGTRHGVREAQHETHPRGLARAPPNRFEFEFRIEFEFELVPNSRRVTIAVASAGRGRVLRFRVDNRNAAPRRNRNGCAALRRKESLGFAVRFRRKGRGTGRGPRVCSIRLARACIEMLAVHIPARNRGWWDGEKKRPVGRQVG